jgi:CHAD domain-containing protein
MAKAHQIRGIDCQASASIGIRLVLLQRFNELLEFRNKALNWDDAEGVHSMRVASRRLRSALRDFEPYMKKRGLTPTLKRIKAVADALGAVRDQDVAIEALEELAPKTSPSVSRTLDHVIQERQDARAELRNELKQTLSNTELRELKSEFTTTIEAATNVSTRTQRELSYSDVAREIIQTRLDEFEALSNDLFKPFDSEALHELRIAGKRLRYAIELFDQCWEVSTLPIAKRIARLQSALGDIHDCDVWIDSFGKQIVESRRRKAASETEALAWLLSHFMKIRIGHLRNSFAQWINWESEDLNTKLRTAVKS